MIVVKLGGSLYQSEDLQTCLDTLEQLSQQHCVIIVPGGGPFADQVRHAQHTYQFNDSTAHHMAILAMSQFGLVLSSLVSNGKLFSTSCADEVINDSLNIWLPNKGLLSEPRLAHSWNVTSDSLALWLAQQLGAEKLVLVKQCSNPDKLSIRQLSDKKVIDQGFQDIYSHTPISTYLLDSKEMLKLPLPLAQPLSL